MGRQRVTVYSREFNGDIRRSWTCELVSHTDGLIVLEGVFEHVVSHPDLGLIERGTRSVEYFWTGRWYNIFRFHTPGGELRNWYCNINMPPSFLGDTLDYVDLDIDIVVWPDMSYAVLDKEEFEANAEKYGYSASVFREVDDAIAELLSMIESRDIPFEGQD